MKLLLISDYTEPDYFSDMLTAQLLSMQQFSVDLIAYPAYLFNGFNPDGTFYGRGYTIYGKLKPHNIPNIVDLLNLSDNAINAYDFILYTSIRRCSLFLTRISGLISRHRVIAIDGEDDQFISHKASLCLYYKRELSPSSALFPNIYPISFFIPSPVLDFLQLNHTIYNNPKTSYLAPCDPRDRSSYTFNTEASYYAQYAASYFGYTMLKGGWDCLRHYEIIAAGSLPYFEGIKYCPKTTLAFYPRQLQELSNLLFVAYSNKSIDSHFLSQYSFLLNSFQAFLKAQPYSLGSTNLVATLSKQQISTHISCAPLFHLLLVLSNIISSFTYCKQQRLRHLEQTSHAIVGFFKFILLNSLRDLRNFYIS